DQIGNRAEGDRLTTQLPFDAVKVSLSLVLLSPQIPLLFMGEEYGEAAPFQYFIEHGDAALIEAVRKGRQQEFAQFGWNADQIPDPQAPATFERSRVNRNGLDHRQAGLLRWTNALIRLRKSNPGLAAHEGTASQYYVWGQDQETGSILRRLGAAHDQALLVFGFNPIHVTVKLEKPVGTWRLFLDSCMLEYGGRGQKHMGRELIVHPQDTSLTIPRYSVLVFLSSDHKT